MPDEAILEAFLVHLDEPAGELEDLPRAPVIPSQHDLGRVGKALAELEDVFQVRAPESIDRLVVVAHDDEVPMGRREARHDPELDRVRVLELVDQNV